MLYKALVFRMNNELWKPPFHTETCSVSLFFCLVIGERNVGNTLGKRNPFPLLPATFVCFMPHKVTRDDNRTSTYYRITAVSTGYVNTHCLTLGLYCIYISCLIVLVSWMLHT